MPIFWSSLLIAEEAVEAPVGTIVATELDPTATPAVPCVGVGHVPVAAYGFPSLESAIGFARFRVGIPLRPRPLHPEPRPLVPIHTVVPFSVGAVGMMPAVYDAIESQITVPVRATGNESDTFAAITVPVRAGGLSLSVEESEETEAPPPLFLDDSVAVGEVESAFGTEGLFDVAVVRRVLGVGNPITTQAEGANAVQEDLAIAEALSVIYRLALSEGVSLAAAATATPRALERVVERMLLLGLVESEAEALSSIVDALAAAAVAQPGGHETITEAAGLADAVASAFIGAEALIDRLSAGVAVEHTGLMVAAVTEAMGLATTLTTELDAFNLIQEGAAFVIRLALDNGHYIGWSLGAQNRQLSRYTNFPFNSFCKLGGKYLGATAEGIFELTGADDDGEPIAAKLRGAMTDLGSLAMKQTPLAYIAYSAPTGLILRTITTENDDGDKVAHTYRLRAQPAAATRQARIKLGRGVKSVFMGWEIENVDGGTLDLKALQFLPITMARKIRGENGGDA